MPKRIKSRKKSKRIKSRKKSKRKRQRQKKKNKGHLLSVVHGSWLKILAQWKKPFWDGRSRASTPGYRANYNSIFKQKRN